MQQHAVVDTNVIVSGLIRPAGPPGRVVDAIRNGTLIPVYSVAMLREYEEVLRRPRLRLDPDKVRALLDGLRAAGVRVRAPAMRPPRGLRDDTDWPFMALALQARCPLITGNLRDFPNGLGLWVVTAREWVEVSGR